MRIIFHFYVMAEYIFVVEIEGEFGVEDPHPHKFWSEREMINY